MSKFTPGPWAARILRSRGAAIIEVLSKEKYPVVNWRGFDESFVPIKRHEANARLIATTPDLLKELISMLGELCATCRLLNPQHANCNSCEGTEKARVLIAKAEGTL